MEYQKIKTRAFTLIEVMVVLLIVAIITAVAVLSFGDFGTSRQQRIQVQQLQQVIQAAKQQAILQPAVLGLVFHRHGYQFYRYWHDVKQNSSEWRPLRDDVLSRPDAFSNTTTLTLKDVAHYQEGDHKKSDIHPAILILPDGYVTPFQLGIQFSNGQTFKVQVTSSGEVTVREG